jgi:hypothetical protein
MVDRYPPIAGDAKKEEEMTKRRRLRSLIANVAILS